VSQIDLYKVRDVEAENAANAKRDAIREEDRMRADNFRNLTELMFNLRKEFVTELTSKECRNHLPDIVRYSTRVGEQYGMDFDTLGEVLGVELSEAVIAESDKSWQEILEIEAAFITMPEKVLLAVAFCAADDSVTGYWREAWDSNQQRYVFKHQENSELDETYKVLEALGYEMSDDEKALQNGTHRIFNDYGLKEDTE
jgi:ParB family chromosome partitioning protein